MTIARMSCADCDNATVTVKINRSSTNVMPLCAGCAFWKGLDRDDLIVPDLVLDGNVYIIDPTTEHLTDPPVRVTMFNGTQLGPVRRLRCLGVECGAEGRPPANAMLDGRPT